MTDATTYDDRPWIKHYAAGVPGQLGEPPATNLGGWVATIVAKYGDRPAFTMCLPNGMSATLTYREVDLLSGRFAAFLRQRLGLKRGARVAVQLPNCLAYPVVALGVFKAGCVLVNTNPMYTPHEMIHQFRDSGAQALVIIDMFADKLAEVLPQTQVRHVITASVADLFPLPWRALIKLKLKLEKKIPRISLPHVSLSAALAGHRGQGPWSGDIEGTLGPDELAVIQYTGGTTGVSKGAELTHRNLIANTHQLMVFTRPLFVAGEETILTALPLYHIFAFTVNFLLAWASGAHNVLIPNPRPVANLKSAFAKFPISWITGVNTLYNALTEESWFKDNPPKTLKMGVAGGTALQAAVAEKWQRIVGCPVLEGYGLTEASPVLTFNPIGGKIKHGSIGVPLPGTSLRLVDEDRNPVPAGQPGEIIARGPQVMQRYWQRPEESAQMLRNDWLYTGDVGVMDEEGYFKIVDRKKDMILVSGFNVYPNEVEECIARHPRVLEVAVIGIPDGASGEAVKAFIVPRGPDLSADEVKKHCRQFLTGYKVPRHVEFCNELAKSPIGKILRKNLRQVG